MQSSWVAGEEARKELKGNTKKGFLQEFVCKKEWRTDPRDGGTHFVV